MDVGALNLARCLLLSAERGQEGHVQLVAIAPGGGTPGPIGAQGAIAGVAPLAYALSAQVQRLAGLCHASKRTPPSRAAHHPKWMIYGAPFRCRRRNESPSCRWLSVWEHVARPCEAVHKHAPRELRDVVESICLEEEKLVECAPPPRKQLVGSRLQRLHTGWGPRATLAQETGGNRANLSTGARQSGGRPDSARQRRARPGRVAAAPPSAPPFELLESKLLPPQGPTATVSRAELISSLEGSGAPRLVLLSAGPGWGKTTLLAQWASRSQRPFAWVSVDERDNDPIVLLTYVAVALDRVSRLDPSVFDSLALAGVSVKGTVVPRLGAALAKMSEQCVLVLDDLHFLDNPACLDAIEALTRHVSEGSQMALSARGHRRSRWPRCGRVAWRWRSGRTTCAWTRRRRASC